MFGSIALGFDSDSSASDDEDCRLYRRNLRDANNVLEFPEKRYVMSIQILLMFYL